MKVLCQRVSVFMLCVALLSLAACAKPVPDLSDDVRLVTFIDYGKKDEYPVPSFLIYSWHKPYNRVGKVLAVKRGESERIFVDPEQAVIYSDKVLFTTERGKYTNLVYRIHFSQIPYTLIPFHLTAGNNPGLLVVIAYDGRNRPLLVTTVNTCGCFVSIVPTSYLPGESYPYNWQETEQDVYGEVLPARLEMNSPDDSLLVSIRPTEHRVMNIEVWKNDVICPMPTVVADVLPLSSLKSLELADGQTTSMYYDQWPLKGHVKGAIKPWESILLGLVSLDLYVGMDKEYGSRVEGSNPFYTSLKPWNRTRSDMNDFAGFLKFYGWNL